MVFNFKPLNRVKVFNISWDEINGVRDGIESNINTLNIANKMKLTKSFNKGIPFIYRAIIKRKGIHTRPRVKFENSCKKKQYKNDNNISFRGINRISDFKNFISNINKNNDSKKEEDKVNRSKTSRIKKLFQQSIKPPFKNEFQSSCYKGGDDCLCNFNCKVFPIYYATSKGNYSIVVVSLYFKPLGVAFFQHKKTKNFK